MTLVTIPSTVQPLIKNGRVRIGWVNARVRERITVLRCFRCLRFGHTSANCTQENSQVKLCFLCGSKAYLAAECQNERKCIQCKAIKASHVHRSGSHKCVALVMAKKVLKVRE